MKQNNERIVLFDFCETLVDFQTADAFVDYCRKSLSKRNVDFKEFINKVLRKSRVLIFLEKITRYKYSIHKRLKLWQLSGVNYDVLDDLSKSYYEEMIKPHLIEVTNKILKKRIEEGYYVIIVSGGYDIYLRYYAKDNNVPKVIANKIDFKNDKCTGSFSSSDCMREAKVIKLKQYLKTVGVFDIYESYSDSVTDVPILSIAKHPNVISKKHQNWCEKYNYNELLWK